MAVFQNNFLNSVDTNMDLSDVKAKGLGKGLQMDKSPFHVHCKNCGIVAEYDIIKQTYRCKACGEITGLTEAKNDLRVWRKVRLDSRPPVEGMGLEKCSCPTCGASMVFQAKEASEKCAFCGSNVVRAALTDSSQLPDSIIPFKITEDEARNRFMDWAQENKNTNEGKQVLNCIDQMKQYYLPFRLVRGPVSGIVDSAKNLISNQEIQGFSETSAISASHKMDNLVLNKIEPYEWTELKPFEYAYIGGVPVMLADDSDNDVAKKMEAEISDDVLPDIRKQLSCSSPSLSINFGELLQMNALLPVYFIKSGSFYAVLNGQTGRIAATSNMTKKQRVFPWWLEAAIVTILFALVPYLCVGTDDALYIGISIAFTFALPFFIGMKQSSEGNEAIISRIIRRSRESRALREDGTLTIIENNKVLENPFSHKAVFVEKRKVKNFNPKVKGDQVNTKVPVRYKIFTGWRLLYFILNTININFSPLIVAFFIRLYQNGGDAFAALHSLNYGMLAAYWCITVFLTAMYWIKGMRSVAYERPVIFEIDSFGKILGQSPKSNGHNLRLIHIFGFEFGFAGLIGSLAILAFNVWLVLL